MKLVTFVSWKLKKVFERKFNYNIAIYLVLQIEI